MSISAGAKILRGKHWFPSQKAEKRGILGKYWEWERKYPNYVYQLAGGPLFSPSCIFSEHTQEAQQTCLELNYDAKYCPSPTWVFGGTSMGIAANSTVNPFRLNRYFNNCPQKMKQNLWSGADWVDWLLKTNSKFSRGFQCVQNPHNILFRFPRRHTKLFSIQRTRKIWTILNNDNQQMPITKWHRFWNQQAAMWPFSIK